MPQLVRVPGRHVGLKARSRNGPVVRFGAVAIADLATRLRGLLSLITPLVRRIQRRFAVLPEFRSTSGFRFGGTEQIRSHVESQVGPQHCLTFGADADRPTLASPIVFVSLGFEGPDGAGHVQIATADDTDFAGPASGQELQFDHRSHDRRQMGQRGVDMGFGDWQDRISLVSVRPTLGQPADGSQPFGYGRGNQFLTGSPPECPLDPADLLVDPGTDQPAAIMASLVVLSFKGPKSLAAIKPYNSRTFRSAYRISVYSLVIWPSAPR